MSVILLFLAALAAFALWWLWRQGLGEKPWLEQGVIETGPAIGGAPLPTAKIGLGVFLAVAGALFALFVSAYAMRMQMADWWSLPVPTLLWVNTGVLVLSSAALHWAKGAASAGDREDVKTGLLLAGASSVAFLVGQLVAWQQLSAAGYGVSSNPANSFFYLITGLHGLHVLGGLVGLVRTGERVWRDADTERSRLSVELCALYWHFLLFVWLVLLALLSGWAGEFVVICRQLLA